MLKKQDPPELLAFSEQRKHTKRKLEVYISKASKIEGEKKREKENYIQIYFHASQEFEVPC